MVTYNNIVAAFEELVSKHHFLQTFTHGSVDFLDNKKDTDYPILHLEYTGSSYNETVKAYGLQVYILDIVSSDDDVPNREKEIISDTEQTAEDIVSDIRTKRTVFSTSQSYQLESANVAPLVDQTTNTLGGVLLTLSIGVPFQYDACNQPLTS